MTSETPDTTSPACEFREIPLDRLRLYSEHSDFDAKSPADAAQIESIREFGIECPLTVGSEIDGVHVIVDGQRRHACARLLGLPTVPCMIARISDEGEYGRHRFMLNNTAKPWTQAEKKEALQRLGLTATQATFGAKTFGR